MLDELKNALLEEVSKAIDGSSEGIPSRFRQYLHRTVDHDCFLELSLLACASSLWCGGNPVTGMPAAVGALLLRAGITAHLGTCGIPSGLEAPGRENSEDVTAAILAGDALMALSMEYLAGSCGRHSARLVAEAVKAMGARGMLAGLSLAVDRRDGINSEAPDGRADFELYSGQLARFATHGGALLAGASGILLDDAAQIGLLAGRARFLSSMSERETYWSGRNTATFQARTLMEQAQSLVGSRGDSTLFTSLMYLSDFF
ncbi:MAG: hypothetical protein AVO35_09130 [Candidatus Aegiribacteria sp. MLS_C]|nr:MAG: hypothetical protein AVO35_09130 [Candidatus Aegiribacteria sp. MLS_C]